MAFKGFLPKANQVKFIFGMVFGICFLVQVHNDFVRFIEKKKSFAITSSEMKPPGWDLPPLTLCLEPGYKHDVLLNLSLSEDFWYTQRILDMSAMNDLNQSLDSFFDFTTFNLSEQIFRVEIQRGDQITAFDPPTNLSDAANSSLLLTESIHLYH
ncbi:hypothetical protein TCAL_16011, partial [Tigriopus californicus]